MDRKNEAQSLGGGRPRLAWNKLNSDIETRRADAAVAAIRRLSLPGSFAGAAEVVSNAGFEESEDVITEEKIRLPGHD